MRSANKCNWTGEELYGEHKKRLWFDVLWSVAGCELIAYCFLTAKYMKGNIPQTYFLFVYAMYFAKCSVYLYQFGRI